MALQEHRGAGLSGNCDFNLQEKIMITIAGGIILAVVIVFVVAPVVLGLIGGAILRAVFWFADIGSDSQK
jgi:hypothetical protein